MTQRFITETQEDDLLLWCPKRPLREALVAGFRASSFQVTVLDDIASLQQRITKPSVTVVWVDSRGERSLDAWKKEQQAVARIIFQNKVPVSYVTFDPLWVDRAGKTPQAYGLEVVRELFPGSLRLWYRDVLEPQTPPLSILGKTIEELLKSNGTDQGSGVVYPLWFADVASHIVGHVVGGQHGEHGYQGETAWEWGDLVTALSASLDLSLEEPEHLENLTAPRGTRLSGLSGKEILLQMQAHWQPLVVPEEVVPEPPARLLSDLPKNDVIVSLAPPKTTPVRSAKARSRTKRRIVQHFLFGIIAGILIVGMAFFATRTLMRHVVVAHARDVFTAASVSTSSLTGLQRSAHILLWMETIRSNVTEFIGQGRSEREAALTQLLTLTDGVDTLVEAKDLLKNAYRDIMAGKGEEEGIAIAKQADRLLDEAYSTFSLTQARVSQDATFIAAQLGSREVGEFVTKELPKLRKSIVNTRTLLSFLPSLVGETEKKTYAVVLTDPHELRGSGGRVVAVGIAVFEHGRLFDVQVYKPSALEQLIQGVVAPPEEVKTYLRQQSWSLSDASWDASFPHSAQHMQWFLQKQLQKTVDGVMVLNTNGVASVLRSLEHSDTKLPTADEFTRHYDDLLMTQSASQTAPDEYVVATFSTFMEELQTLQGEDIHRVGATMGELLSSSEMFLYTSDTSIQRSLVGLGWDGDFITPACPALFAADTCDVHTVTVSENTLGNNPVNGFVSRVHNHLIRITNDLLIHERLTTITNSAPRDTWPLGTYQALSKLYLPANASVQAVELNTLPLRPDQFQVVKEFARTALKVRLDVPAGSKATLRVVYTTKGIPPTGSSLVFFEQKQAGMGSDPFTLTIEYPENYAPKTIAPEAKIETNKLIFESRHDQNHLFAVSF